MRAFVKDLNLHGGWRVKVTNEYKTRRGLEDHALDGLPPGQYELEGFYNWDNRYRLEPDFRVRLAKMVKGAR